MLRYVTAVDGGQKYFPSVAWFAHPWCRLYEILSYCIQVGSAAVTVNTLLPDISLPFVLYSLCYQNNVFNKKVILPRQFIPQIFKFNCPLTIEGNYFIYAHWTGFRSEKNVLWGGVMYIFGGSGREKIKVRAHRTYFLTFTVRYPNLRECYFYKQ